MDEPQAGVESIPRATSEAARYEAFIVPLLLPVAAVGAAHRRAGPALVQAHAQSWQGHKSGVLRIDRQAFVSRLAQPGTRIRPKTILAENTLEIVMWHTFRATKGWR